MLVLHFGKVGLVTMIGISVIVAVAVGFWMSTASGMLYKSLSTAEIYSKAVLWVDSRTSFYVCNGLSVYRWDASNYWEVYLTLVNRGPVDVVIDDVYINGVPYYDLGCLTRYHVVVEADGGFKVFSKGLIIRSGGKVVLRVLIPGAGFTTYEGHSGVFYSGDGDVFRHGDSLTISFVSDGSTLAIVLFLP